jgi:uncharacterized membrane protein
MSRTDLTSSHEGNFASVLERNISALVERRRREDRERPKEKKIADAITRFTGSMVFVYLHLFIFGAWIITNLKWTPFPKFDPSFVVLAMFASVEAIFLSTFVLITQNRLASQASRRAELDLQISLLAEHEITRLVKLVSAMAEKMEIQESRDPDLAELKNDISPDKLLDQLEAEEKKLRPGPA